MVSGKSVRIGRPPSHLYANLEYFNNTKHRFETSTEIPPTLLDLISLPSLRGPRHSSAAALVGMEVHTGNG